MRKHLILLLLAIAVSVMADATAVYKSKALFGRRAKAYSYVEVPTKNGVCLDSLTEVTKIPRGQYVTLKDTILHRLDEKNVGAFNYLRGVDDEVTYAIIEYEGETYAVHAYDLVFSKRKSDKGEKDYLALYHKSPFQRLWYKPWPALLIFLLVVYAYMLIWMAGKKEDKAETARLLALSGYVTCTVAILEIIGLSTVEGGVFWWLNPLHCGFLRTTLRTVPVVLAAFMQFGGLYRIMRTVNKQYGSEEKKITLKPIRKVMLYTLLGVIVSFFIACIFKNYFLQVVVLIACIGAAFYLLRSKVQQPMNEYKEILGDEIGRSFTNYVLIWTSTGVFSAFFYFIGLAHVIVPVIVAVIFVIGCIVSFVEFILFLGGPLGAELAKSVPQAMVFLDKGGGAHTSGAARDSANAAIDSRS